MSTTQTQNSTGRKDMLVFDEVASFRPEQFSQSRNRLHRKDTAIQNRQTELSRNMDSGFITRVAAQAECAIYGHEWLRSIERTQCFYCGAPKDV